MRDMATKENPSEFKKKNFQRIACGHCLNTKPLLWKYSSQGKDLLICDECYNKMPD